MSTKDKQTPKSSLTFHERPQVLPIKVVLITIGKRGHRNGKDRSLTEFIPLRQPTPAVSGAEAALRLIEETVRPFGSVHLRLWATLAARHLTAVLQHRLAADLAAVGRPQRTLTVGAARRTARVAVATLAGAAVQTGRPVGQLRSPPPTLLALLALLLLLMEQLLRRTAVQRSVAVGGGKAVLQVGGQALDALVLRDNGALLVAALVVAGAAQGAGLQLAAVRAAAAQPPSIGRLIVVWVEAVDVAALDERVLVTFFILLNGAVAALGAVV